MVDQSHLDRKYFIDNCVYNCPFCNRRNLKYENYDHFQFNWTNDKICYAYLVQCNSCEKISFHLSFERIIYDTTSYYSGRNVTCFCDDIDIDSKIFYSVPTSFFVLDDRIPAIIRELITEAEECLKMNLLTGSSACTRKSIYELLVKERIEGADYQSGIKLLKDKYPSIDSILFDILIHIQDMTSDKIHEQSWDKWDSGKLKLILETLKNVIYEIYVLPAEKKERSLNIQKLRESMVKDKEHKKKLS